jgi:hypothetical protein
MSRASHPDRQTYKRGAEVLAELRGFYRVLADRCRAIRDETRRQRAGLLLEHLRRHSESREAFLARQELDAPQEVKDTWFQYVPHASSKQRAESLSSDLPLEELVDRALEREAELVATYDTLAGSSESAAVQQFFAALHECEASLQRALARDLQQLRDL